MGIPDGLEFELETMNTNGIVMNTEQLVVELRLLSRNAEELLEATVGDLTDKAKEARAGLRKALESAKDSCERLQEKAVAGARATDQVIREHPYQSMGVAFGVGLLIGVLAMRRNSG